jgi:peptidoglycan/LPS O-acetylase OafA/YrhL
LDGLRGLAALSVLICHFTLYGTAAEVTGSWRALRQGALAGWIGVDLFFVLSGFLITGILMDIRQSAGGLRAFYLNRALRIFPLYGVVVAVTVVLLPAIFRHRADFLNLSEMKWWYFTYTINVLIARQGWPEHGALAHFWSLAVEEQFYLVWPAIVLMCTRARLIGTCFAVLVLAPLQRLLLHHVGYATAAYVLTSTRMDALAAGALVALLARSSPGLDAYRSAARRVCAISVTVWVTIVWVGGQDPEGFLMGTVGYSVLAFAFAAALVMLLTDDRSPAARLLSRGAFRWLGQHSYALYVLHHILIFLLLPAIAAAIAGQGHQLAALARPAAVALVAILTFALASLSWRFIEAPALSRKRRYAHTAEWQGGMDMPAPANAQVTPVHDR